MLYHNIITSLNLGTRGIRKTGCAPAIRIRDKTIPIYFFLKTHGHKNRIFRVPARQISDDVKTDKKNRKPNDKNIKTFYGNCTIERVVFFKIVSRKLSPRIKKYNYSIAENRKFHGNIPQSLTRIFI